MSGYDAKYLNRRARDGSLGAFKDGRNRKITKLDLEKYVAQNKE